MLPDNRPSSIAVPGIFLSPDGDTTTPLIDYEMGGVALNNASQGLQYQRWTCYLSESGEIVLKPDSGSETVLFTRMGVTEIAFTFDQNMRPCVAFVQNGNLILYWFDSVAGSHIFTLFSQARNPKLALDDKRRTTLSGSDVVLAYIRGDSLYYREQRDRFGVERELRSGILPTTKLRAIGMSTTLRMQFELV